MTYYHGTTVLRSIGDFLTPGNELGVPYGRVQRVYFTSSLLAAFGYAHHKAAAQLAIMPMGTEGSLPSPVVYRVEPTFDYEPDPTVHERFEAFRTTGALRILSRIEPPFTVPPVNVS